MQHEIHLFKDTMVQRSILHNKIEDRTYIENKYWSLAVQTFRYADISVKQEQNRNAWSTSAHDWRINQINVKKIAFGNKEHTTD